MATHSLKFKKDSSIAAVWIEYTYNGAVDEKKITSTTTQTINFDSGTWIGVSDYDIADGYTTPVYVKNGSTGNSFNMTTNGNWGYQSSTAPSATYTIYATEEEATVYDYKFKNSTGYPLVIYYDLDTVSSTRMSIANGATYTLTCEPGTMYIDCDSSTIDGECLNDLVYWQRTSPTTGTKYTLGDSGDNGISLRSAGTATYTFTNKSYSPAEVYEYSWRVYTYVDGVSHGYESDSYESEDSSYSLFLRDYVDASYYNNYDYAGYSFSTTGTKYSGDYATLSPGQVQYVYVHFTTPVTYYPYELRVRIDGVRESDYDESYSKNTSQTIYFENILSTSLFDDYKYIGYRTSSAGAIKTGSSHKLTSTSSNILYIEFETPLTYYPYNVYVYVDGDYIDDFDKSSSDNVFSTIDLSSILTSALFNDYEFLHYKKNSSSTEYTSYTSVSLSSGTETDIYVYFQSIYYPYRVYVYVDGDHIDDYDKSSSTNHSNTIDLSSVLSSTLFNDYVFSHYTKGSSSTEYTSYTSVNLTKNTTVSIYVYFTTPVFTVTFRHLQDGTYVESTTEYVNRGSTIYPENYMISYTHYVYDHAVNTSGTTITSVKVTSNIIINLYYVLTSYTITFRHMLGDSSQETTESFKAMTTITLENYSGNYSGYLYDHAEDSNGDEITSLTVVKTTIVYLIYILNTVTITFEHYRGKRKYGDDTTAEVDYGSTVSGSTSAYHRTDIPCCTYAKASSSITATSPDQKIKIYYKYRWDNPPKTGQPWKITASEWNYLRDFIDDQRLADGKSKSGLASVKQNETFTFTHYNNMGTAIGKGSTVIRWQEITQALMDELVTNANAMAGL